MSNVAASWAGHLVFIVAGFIMPRLMDRHIGQEALGVWDFGWSLVNYLNLAGLSVGSSVGRYVAKFRAVGDVDGLRKAVSSVMCIQFATATLVTVVTGILWILVPRLFGERLGTEVSSARAVIACLGLSLAVRMAFDTSRGVMTGCHRWDLHNGISAGSRTVEAAAMFVVLVSGGGLIGLGIVVLGAAIVTEVARLFVSRRVCPELRCRLEYVSWSHASKMFWFGVKSVAAGLPMLVLVQTSNIVIVGTMGAAALAVFSRSVALVRHVETFMNKLSFVLTPTAGAMQGEHDFHGLRELLKNSTRHGIVFVLPPILFLVAFGDVVLKLWMGANYVESGVLAILAAGYALPVSQSASLHILVGLNKHGRIALFTLGVAVLGFAFSAMLMQSVGWSLVGSALAIAIPLTIGNGILLPLYACRQLELPVNEYVRYSFARPMALVAAYGACLVVGHALFPDRKDLAAIAGGAGGAAVIASLYCAFLLPEHLRVRIFRFGFGATKQ